MRRIALFALAVCAAVSAFSRIAPAQDSSGVRLGVSLNPDTVTVGDPFLLSVRVRAPLGTKLTFPAPPDTGGVVEGVDPMVVRESGDSLAVDRTALYRLAAWDTGSIAVELDDVALSGTVERTFRIDPRYIYVRSVLPADTTRQVPRPARDIFATAPVWWWKILLAVVALAVISLLVWWWWRRRRGREAGEQTVDPFDRSEREFVRLEGLRLPDAGEAGRHVAIAADIVRDYLAARVEGAAPSLTTGELLGRLRPRLELPLDRLGSLLAEADLIKFAARRVRPERARQFSDEARKTVAEVERVELARSEAAESAKEQRAA